MAAGGAVAAGMHAVRSAFVGQLEPVTTEAGKQRLWHHDLRPYQALRAVSTMIELDNGLLGDGQAYWWRREGFFTGYGAIPREPGGCCTGKVRVYLALPWNITVKVPGGSVTSGLWSGRGRILLKRLWPGAANLSPERVSHILTVADVDEAHLRGLLVEGRALPVGLRDTLERFAADARIEAFSSAWR